MTTAKLIRSAPVLLVRDVQAAEAYYRDAIGFNLSRFYGEPPTFVILARDTMHLMLKQIDDHAQIIPRTTVSPGIWDMYFWVDDADALYEELVGRKATIVYEPCNQDYGCREFGARDLDGHEIGFGQVIA